ncbi:MAG TPA: histidine phosphatase family protein [Steroidobacteraceae bacterium]|nr:histidine phosphatase family protein [Steroidobacteraceae bacterium]
MPSPSVLLIRHGQSQANAGGVTLENPVVPLTELGSQQARTLAGLLPSETPAVWASPFKRALDTAAPYCERLGITAKTHADLREFEVIDTQLMRGSPCAEREAVLARYWLAAEPDARTGPAGETFREFHERINHMRRNLLPSLPDGSVVFGHGLCMALLFWQLWGFEKVDQAAMIHFRRFQLGFPTPNAVVYGLTHVVPGQWTIRVNESALRAVAAIGVDPERGEQRCASVPS